MMDKSDIERLFKANYASMLQLAVAILHDSDVAGDIVHEVFASLLGSALACGVDRMYLLKATRNRALNHIRNLEARERIARMYTLYTEEESDESGVRIPDYAEMSRIIDSSLPPKCAEVVRMRFYDGMKYAAISESLGISEAAVYKHLRRAVDRLRSIFNEDY